MPPLEELYRRLLIAYPAGYREQHEAEILTTLIDAAEEGRRLPSPREAAGLLVGGLRTRGVIAGRQGWRTLWADALRVAAVLLLASRLADTQVLYLDAVGPRVRLVPVLLALGMVAAVRGAGRLSRGLLVLGGVVASVYWTQPVGGTMLTPQRLAADISEYVTPLYRAPAVAPVVLAMGLILWQVFLRAARRPWSWWLAVALVAYALVLQLSEREGIWSGLEGLGHVVAAVSLPRLALPGVPPGRPLAHRRRSASRSGSRPLRGLLPAWRAQRPPRLRTPRRQPLGERVRDRRGHRDGRGGGDHGGAGAPPPARPSLKHGLNVPKATMGR